MLASIIISLLSNATFRIILGQKSFRVIHRPGKEAGQNPQTLAKPAPPEFVFQDQVETEESIIL